MPIQDIIQQCSPTLAGMKTGSLFSAKAGNHAEAKKVLRDLNRILRKKGLRAVPLQYREKSVLIYLYRPDRLQKDLENDEVRSILQEKGYGAYNADLCIVELINRLRQEPDFPHEIGVFLSYPPEDVRGFMNNPCCGVQCVGCWKVYGNREEAEKTFRKYKKCTEIYQKKIHEGKSLDQLIVPA